MDRSEKIRAEWIRKQSNRNAVYSALCQVRSLVNEGLSVKHACNYVLDAINLEAENLESKWAAECEKERLAEVSLIDTLLNSEVDNDNHKQ